MSKFLKIVLFSLKIIGLLAFNFSFGQKNAQDYNFYKKVINSDTTSQLNKLKYADAYIQKAKDNQDYLALIQAMDEKSFLVDFEEEKKLVLAMEAYLPKINNDSITGDYLIRKTALYFFNRNYKDALKIAIESEKFNRLKKNSYSLFSSKIDIANVYFHTKNYPQAKVNYLSAVNFFKTQNNKSLYLISLYGLGKTNWKLKDLPSFQQTIQEIEMGIPQVSAQKQITETGYLNLLKGGYAYENNKYTEAKDYFNKALPITLKKRDFANEHLIYLNLGKIAWQQGHVEEAFSYLKKVDDLFTQKQFLNYELREAYTYLIAYAKQKNNLQLQVTYTEKLNKLNIAFEEEQTAVTHMLYTDYETKKLQDENLQVKQELAQSYSWNKIIGILSTVLGIFVLGYVFYLNTQKQKLQKQFKTVISKTNPEPDLQKAAPNFTEQPLPETAELTVTEIRLLKEIEKFEQNKDFLKPVRLEDLAEAWATNRNTLSKVFNTHKNGFLPYINQLRIQQLVTDLQQNPELRRIKIQDLAESYGFNNTKTFNTQFKAETQLTPSYFIEQLEKSA